VGWGGVEDWKSPKVSHSRLHRVPTIILLSPSACIHQVYRSSLVSCHFCYAYLRVNLILHARRRSLQYTFIRACFFLPVLFGRHVFVITIVVYLVAKTPSCCCSCWGCCCRPSRFSAIFMRDNFSQGVLVLYNHSRIRRRCLPVTYMPLNEKGRRKNFQNRQINNITSLVDDGQIFCRKIIWKVIELPSRKCAVTSTRKSLTLIGELTE